MSQNSASANKTIILTVAGLMGFVILLVLAGPVLWRRDAQDAPALTSTTVAPDLFIPPTPDCGAPTLTIGTTTSQIQTIHLSPDGSVSMPEGVNDIAYWVDDTDMEFIFIMSPPRKISRWFPGSPAERLPQ